MKRYRMVYTWDDADKVWLVRARDIPGCHTFGATIDEARTNAREALGLFVDDLETAVVVDEFHLPPQAREPVAGVQAAAQKAAKMLTQRLRIPPKDASRLVHGADTPVRGEFRGGKSGTGTLLRGGSFAFSRSLIVKFIETNVKEEPGQRSSGTRRARTTKGATSKVRR